MDTDDQGIDTIVVGMKAVDEGTEKQRNLFLIENSRSDFKLWQQCDLHKEFFVIENGWFGSLINEYLSNALQAYIEYVSKKDLGVREDGWHYYEIKYKDVTPWNENDCCYSCDHELSPFFPTPKGD